MATTRRATVDRGRGLADTAALVRLPMAAAMRPAMVAGDMPQAAADISEVEVEVVDTPAVAATPAAEVVILEAAVAVMAAIANPQDV